MLNLEADFRVYDDGILIFKNRLCIYDDQDLEKKTLEETYSSKISIHPNITKMYRNLRSRYWWISMKNDIFDFVSNCLTCQRIKIEH